MRSVGRVAVPAIALALALVAQPASAGHGGVHPTFRSETVYFHCTGPSRVYQVNWWTVLGTSDADIPWDTKPPTGSLGKGEACAGWDWGGTTNSAYDVVFRGTFKGNIRDVTVRAHQLVTHKLRIGGSETLRLYAEVDGVAVFPKGTNDRAGRKVSVTPVPSSSGDTESVEFSITNLGRADETGTGGAALEDGDGTLEHTFTLYLGVDGASSALTSPTGSRLSVWAWDATEVPAGLTFNPPKLAASTVAADLPNLGSTEE